MPVRLTVAYFVDCIVALDTAVLIRTVDHIERPVFGDWLDNGIGKISSARALGIGISNRFFLQRIADEMLGVREIWEVARGARPLTLHSAKTALHVIGHKDCLMLLSAGRGFFADACATGVIPFGSACAGAFIHACVRQRKV